MAGMESAHPRSSQDAIEQGKLLRKRDAEPSAPSRALTEPLAASPHEWQRIAVGRVCKNCHVAQEAGAFDDHVPCEAA
jgi:hypothetical protein